MEFVEDLLGKLKNMFDLRPNRIMLRREFEECGKGMNHSMNILYQKVNTRRLFWEIACQLKERNY